MQIYKPTLKHLIPLWIFAMLAFIAPPVGAAVAAYALIVTISSIFYRMGHTLTIADDEILWEVGIVSKETVGIKRSDIRAIKVKQGLGGKILGYGDIYIASAGTGGYEIKALRLNHPKKIESLLRQ